MPVNYLIDGLQETGDPHPQWFSDMAFVCPFCGELWARIWKSGKEWRGVTLACTRCAKPWPLSDCVPGSLIEFLGADVIDYLPPAVLRRELDLHVKQIGVKNENETNPCNYS